RLVWERLAVAPPNRGVFVAAPDADEARAIRDSLDPVRRALRETRPPEKPHAHQKYWQTLLGQTGGRVRPPCLDLTHDEREATRKAFDACGLRTA
ncbi:MAG: hypothetical protein ACK414_08495, partial [Gemmobacter sp.]